MDCKSFAGHYEIKSLRVESMYSSYSNLVLSQSQEAHVASVSGCTSLEYYELPMGIRTLSEGDFKDCKLNYWVYNKKAYLGKISNIKGYAK